MATAEDISLFLQHCGIDPDEEGSLAHFGVKGVHWHVRRSKTDRIAHLDRKLAKSKSNVAAHEESIKNIKSHVKDANDNGVTSELFRKQYGDTHSAVFPLINGGMPRNEALAQHKSDLNDELGDRQFELSVHQARTTRLQKKRDKLVASS